MLWAVRVSREVMHVATGTAGARGPTHAKTSNEKFTRSLTRVGHLASHGSQEFDFAHFQVPYYGHFDN